MTSPIAIAVIASIFTLVVFNLSRKIPNKYLKGLGQFLSFFLGIFIAAALSSDTKVATMSGQYYFIILIAMVILGKIIGRGK